MFDRDLVDRRLGLGQDPEDRHGAPGRAVREPGPLDPPAGGIASGRRVVFAPEAPAAGTPTFHLHMLADGDGNPIWRGITCAGVQDVALPDLSSIGVAWPPTGQPLSWTMWSITGPGPYRDFTYRWLGSAYWRAYASATYAVEFPTSP